MTLVLPQRQRNTLHHLKPNEHHSEHQNLNCSYYSTSSPIRDRTISENSSISTPKSPIKHYSSTNKRSSNKHRTNSSNNKEHCPKKKTPQYRSQVTVTTSWHDKLRSAVVSFLLWLWTHAIHRLKTTRRNILYTKPRDFFWILSARYLIRSEKCSFRYLASSYFRLKLLYNLLFYCTS
jgi:hypothetical protein